MRRKGTDGSGFVSLLLTRVPTVGQDMPVALCAKGVAPNINAFRNLDDKGLIMRSAGGLGASKELLAQDGSLELEARLQLQFLAYSTD